MKQLFFILVFSVAFSNVLTGQSQNISDLNWKIFHAVDITEFIDCQSEAWKTMSKWLLALGT